MAETRNLAAARAKDEGFWVGQRRWARRVFVVQRVMDVVSKQGGGGRGAGQRQLRYVVKGDAGGPVQERKRLADGILIYPCCRFVRGWWTEARAGRRGKRCIFRMGGLGSSILTLKASSVLRPPFGIERERTDGWSSHRLCPPKSKFRQFGYTGSGIGTLGCQVVNCQEG